MPKPKKKKQQFIDPKNAVKFSLVHRSQQDPLQADEEASKGVLVDATPQEKKSAREEEQKKFGVYFDDEYDYLQHLRDVKELSQVEPTEVYRLEPEKKKNDKKPQIMLPSTVFESAVETKVGLLNKGLAVTGPQPDWDPDVVEALDDDFDFDNPDNQLDDDFISKAMATDGPGMEAECGEDEIGSDFGSDFGSDDADMMGSDDEFFDEYTKDPFSREETRSQFTEYSMTSSVVPRSEALTLVDDRFEHMFTEYDDAEIGPLDNEEIEGLVDYGKELLDNALEEYEREKKNAEISLADIAEPCGGMEIPDQEEQPKDFIDVAVDETPNKSQWDCESILSTYSTLYNHPKLIEEPQKNRPIRLTKRLGIPDDVLPQRGPTLRQQEEELHITDIERASTYRPRDETAEEKRLRKQGVKQERKARREEKKSTKQAFKEETKKQNRELQNVRQALGAVHLQ